MITILNNDINCISGVGKVFQSKLSKLGIKKVSDMLTFYPRSLEDRSKVTKIADAISGENACIVATVVSEIQERKVNKLTIHSMKIRDDSGIMLCVFFNNKYVKNSFVVGNEYAFYGRINHNYKTLEIISPVFEENDKFDKTRKILPVYPLTSGLNQTFIRNTVRKCLDGASMEIEESLPEYIRKRYSLCSLSFALENIHFPKDAEAYFIAKKRLVFEELFLLQMGLRSIKDKMREKTAIEFKVKDPFKFINSLPFSLTNAQKKVINEICNDLKNGFPLNRLVQGDVGSGKTCVAQAIVYMSAKSGFQSTLMVPTEILARQHFKSFETVFSDFGINCVLLTGSLSAKEKKEAISRIESGEADVIIGTHALIEDNVKFKNLGLIITDEQHRFGVRQREALVKKGNSPHVLVMTATPIPRTLALILYGDLDISLIDELPPTRKEVKTYFVKSDKRKRIYSFIEKEAQKSHQSYIVCPMVEENDNTELQSVKSYSDNLHSLLPSLRIEYIYGGMKATEKKEIMEKFSLGEIDVLVSTTVIEVGVDVPNATIMVIENAERFGLSQLHQLRGRIGRGSFESYCILISDSESKISVERLNIMKKSSNGNYIAEKDLELRGPGDFFGTKQHGLFELKIANLFEDSEVLKLTGELADFLLKKDPTLDFPENILLKKKINELFDKNRDILQ